MWITFAIIALFLLVFLFGSPTEIKFIGTPPFFEITWKIEEEPQISKSQLQPPSQQPKKPEIKIDSLKIRQEIYQPGDTAYVDFEVTNELNISYNITTDWLYNNNRYHGWFNVSTDFYNTTIQKNYWNSWYTVQKVGDWEIHFVIEYSLLNRTFSKDKIAQFRVV